MNFYLLEWDDSPITKFFIAKVALYLKSKMTLLVIK